MEPAVADAPKSSLLHAVTWSSLSNVINEITVAAVTFVLAALLRPDQYGTVAMAYLYVIFIQMLVGFGFSTALVQRKELKAIHVNSVFWLNLSTGLAFAAVAILLSGWWSRINHMPDLRPIIVVLSALIPIESLSIVQVALLQKQMDFKGLAIRGNVGTAVGGAAGITLATLGYGVWALVGQQIAAELARVLLLWRISHWRPAFAFQWSAIKELSGYAGKTFLGQIGGFFQNQSDSLLIGVLVGPTALGLYRLADRLVEMNLKFLPRAMQIVSLPHFSRLQHDRDELNKSFLFNCHLCGITTFPAMGFLAGASAVTLAAIGKQWTSAATVLQILALIGISKVILLFVGPLLQALSRPGIHSFNVWTLVAANSLAVCLAVGLFSHAPGERQIIWVAAIRTIVFIGIFTPLLLWQAKRASGLSLLSLLKVLWPAMVITLIVAASQWLFHRLGLWTPIHNRYAALMATALVAFLIWLLCVYLFDQEAFRYLRLALEKARQVLSRFALNRGLPAPVAKPGDSIPLP
jgi:PST family polysaccharide transporter